MNKEVFAKTASDAVYALDHLLLGIADLDRGIEWMQERTGVRATMGGSHPGMGTRNALISLDNRQYIEIISIDPKQKQRGWMAALVRNLAAPQIITWAVSTEDIDALSDHAKAAGYSVEGPSNGERAKPDGSILKWRTLRIIGDLGEAIPFFIEWGAGIKHPSQDSPSGCRLKAFKIEHPEADHVQNMLLEFRIKTEVNPGIKPRFKAILSTPKGMVELQ